MTYNSWFSDFAHCLEDYLMYKHDSRIMCQYNLVFDLKIKVGLYDLYFMIQ